MSETPCTCGDSVSVSVECATANAEIVVELSELPVEHAATHNAAGSDPVTVATSQVTGFTAAAAAAAPVQSVAGRTGAVVLAKADVGLANVDNTADASKPVSTAQAAADAAVQAAAVQRANHTGTQLAATISDFAAAVSAAAPPTTDASLLTSGTLADARLSGNVVLTSDSRLADSREWSAATIDQAEAEAGTATTRRAFTALRVFQAIAAWWAGSAAAAKLTGIATGATANATDAQLRDRATHTGTQASTTITGLGGAATLNVGTTAGTVAAGAHVHAAGDITSGTIATARLGSGTASSSTFLRGDQTYAAPVTSVNSATGAVTLPTMVEFTPTASTATGATKTDYSGYAVWEWTIPSAAQYAIVELLGAGAGGGSGRRGAAGSARGGGGGGGAGPFRRVVWRLADLSSRALSIQLAAGGAGGASVTADDTSGNPGSQPAATSNITINASPYHVVLRTSSPGNGGGGTTSVGSGGNGAQSSSSDPFGGSPGGAGGVGAAGTAGTAAQCEASSGGGGGGGLDTGNTTRAGGAGGAANWIGASAGGTAGTAGGGNGANGSTFGASIAATGGGGGGSATAAAGGNGGNGGRGAGGGGGGASSNGFNSGAGGNGGDAVCRIILF